MGPQELADQLHRVERLVRLHIGPHAEIQLWSRPRHGIDAGGRPLEGLEIVEISCWRWPDRTPLARATTIEGFIEQITSRPFLPSPPFRKGDRSA